MSTICKLLIHTKDIELVKTQICKTAETLGLIEGEHIETDYPDVYDSFSPSYDFPNRFSFKLICDGIVEVYFNSFSPCENLCIEISSLIEGIVLVNLHQSTATASLWSYYDNGKLIRSVEAGDGEVSKEKGGLLVTLIIPDQNIIKALWASMGVYPQEAVYD